MSTVNNTQPDTSPLPEEAWLRCPGCDYCLVGLTEHRCPECGVPFDIEHLRALGSETPQPVHPWDDRAQIGFWRAFGETCWATWVHPRAFARTLPAHPSALSGWSFSLVCYTLAVALLALGESRLVSSRDALERLMMPAAACGVIVCEILVAALLNGVLHVKRGRAKLGYKFWRGLTHYSSSYLVLSTAVLSAYFALDTAIPRGTSFGLGDAVLGAAEELLCVASLILWWRAFFLAIRERGQGGSGRHAVAAILVVVAAILAGVVALGVWLSCILFGNIPVF
jgi:hypothetical protein